MGGITDDASSFDSESPPRVDATHPNPSRINAA